MKLNIRSYPPDLGSTSKLGGKLMSADATKHKSKTNPAMWAATIAGLLIGRYTGVDLLIPLVGAVVTFYALKKLASPKRAHGFRQSPYKLGTPFGSLLAWQSWARSTPTSWIPRSFCSVPCGFS